MHTLKIEHLTVEVENKTILKDFNLEIKSGEIHAIMGPNGTGKSTLSKVIMGYPGYHILEGSITYDETIINDLSVDKRAKIGLFLGMQMPLEIEGVTNADFLRSALNEKEKDIITKHMWPVTIQFPKSIEGFVLTFVDKYCALSETFDVFKTRLFRKQAFRYAYVFLSLMIIKL